MAEIDDLKGRLAEADKKSHLSAEQLKSKLQLSLKDMAIKEQNAQFLKIQLEETQQQL